MKTQGETLAILGAYPPPYGGMSVHVERFCAILENRGIPYIVYNGASPATDEAGHVISVYSKRRRWMLRYAFTAREDTIYVLSDRLSAWLIGGLMSLVRRKRVVVRLRNAALLDWHERRPVKAWLARFALRHVSGVVCVNEPLKSAVTEAGVRIENVHLSPGFLAPTPGDWVRPAPDGTVWDFVDRRHPILVTNGKIRRPGGEDVYGLEHAIALTKSLKETHPDIGLVASLVEVSEDCLSDLSRSAVDLGIGDHVVFQTEPGPLLPVLAEAQLFLRLTTTDGDANSLREALYLGVPAIASNAVPRPHGTHTYETGNISQLREIAGRILETSKPRMPLDASAAQDLSDRARVYVDFVLGRTES